MDATEPARPPLTENEAMLTADERRPLTVAGHHAFRESFAGPSRDFDDIDELVEALRAAEFEEKGARS